MALTLWRSAGVSFVGGLRVGDRNFGRSPNFGIRWERTVSKVHKNIILCALSILDDLIPHFLIGKSQEHPISIDFLDTWHSVVSIGCKSGVIRV